MALTKVQSEMAGAGQVLQVVSSNYGTYPTSTTSSAFVSTGHSVTITPKFATSKILLIVHSQCLTTGTGNWSNFTFFKNGSNMNTAGYSECGVLGVWVPLAMTCFDSPATTSAITYSVAYKTNSGTSYYCGNTNELAVFTAMEIAA